MSGPQLAIAVPTDLGRIELHRVRLALVEPFVASHGTERDREVVLVRAMSDARDGWAECSTLRAATYVDESTDGAWKALHELAPAVLAGSGQSCSLDLDGRRAAVAAVEVALADLTGSWRAGWPSARRASVPCTAVIGQRSSIDDVVAAVGIAVEQGFRSVKLKVGSGWDVEPVAAVRQSWPDLSLAVDANGSYSIDDVDRITALVGYDLRYIEQPLPGRELSTMAMLRRIGTRIALDESIRSVADLRTAVDAAAVDVVNVKPARVGGLAAAVEVARAARAAGVSAFVGGMLETGVGRSAALRLAARPEFDRPTDLGPSGRYFVDDVTDPIGWAGPGEVAVPGGDHLVVAPRSERLAAVTVDRAVFER